MEAYSSDKEQVEMLKKFWQDYGRYILVAVVIGLVLGFGWRYWRQARIQTAQEASVLYQNLAVFDANKQFERTQGIAKKLMQDYKGTPYASLAALVWARESVQRKDFAVAKQKLQWVVDNGSMNVLRQLARLRLARILLMEKQAKSALSVLDKLDNDMFKPLAETIRGDAYTQLQDQNKAHKAYLAAKAAYKALDLNDPILNMKIDSGA